MIAEHSVMTGPFHLNVNTHMELMDMLMVWMKTVKRRELGFITVQLSHKATVT